MKEIEDIENSAGKLASSIQRAIDSLRKSEIRNHPETHEAERALSELFILHKCLNQCAKIERSLSKILANTDPA